jgi:four helix bundle protein
VPDQNKQPPRTFEALEVTLLAIRRLKDVVGKIRRCDRDLGDQIRASLSSVALNLAEANGSEGGNRLSRFSTAAGSNQETRAALRVAVAWGYVGEAEVAVGEALLDRVAAMLHRLGARR